MTAEGQCSEADLVLVFTVTNNGGPLVDNAPYTVTGPNGYSQQGFFGPLAPGASETIDLGSVPPGTYVFEGVYGRQELAVTTEVVCVELPNLTAVGECTEPDLVLVFTVTNNAGSLGSTAYTVTGPNGYSETGNFGPLAAGESATIDLGSVPPGYLHLHISVRTAAGYGHG